ncbi:FAS1 domain-containing protein [Hirschfeldia incana]|nr:FAS1 domain-containing protein [Hirschfeldia incana]
MTTSSHLLLLFLIATVSFLTPAAFPPSITPQDQQHADRIIQAMIGAGEFRDWAADFLSAVDDQFGIPLSATIFIPSDFDAAGITSSSSIGGATNPGRLSVAYHIVPQRLSFADLRILQPLSRLPTLLPGNSIVVTNNSVSDFTVDGVLVSEPDLFLSSSIAIHGVASPLDFSRYGDFEDGGDTALADSLRPLSQRRRRRGRGSPDGFDYNQTSASVSVVGRLSASSFLLPLAMAALF